MSDTAGLHSESVSRESSVDAHGNPHDPNDRSSAPLAALTPSLAQGAQPEDRDPSGPRFLRACDNCRRRKVKCNGERPSCSHCRRVDAPCHYSVKPKSRRMWKCLETPEVSAAPAGAAVSAAAGDKRIADSTTAKLLARVETMERLLMQRSGLNSPRMPAGFSAVPGGDDGAAGAASAMAHMPAQAGQQADNGYPHAAAGSGAGGAQFHSGPSGGAAGMRFHGGSGAPSRRDSEGRSADAHPQKLGAALGGEHQGSVCDAPAHLQAPGALSPELVSDLVDTLFAGSNHIIELIHEQSFRKQFAAGTISPLLLYSALASAARYSKNPAVCTDPPSSASAPFINRAKALVVDALEDPSLGNAQGLVIMCMMNFSLGNEIVTTSYKSLALNMCIMLGFNRLDSVNGHVQPNTNCTHDLMTSSTMAMDWVDREAARRLWWTIFSIENYSSVCMGLTPSIQAEYCDVNLPASTAEWMQGRPLLEPELSLDADAEAPSKRRRLSENPIQQLAAYHAQLSLIFSKVAWLVTRTNAETEGSVAQFSELNTVLQRWYEGLPKELRLSSVDTLLYGNQDSSDYYQICVLHMRFYATVIQLNHAIPEFTEDSALIEPGQRKCVIAASRISDLLRSSFEIPVDMRDMNWYMCVFRAAHIHIYRLLSRDAESIARAKQDLAVHRRHLRDGGPMWRICYKLLNRLDDMEQMVMLLPAQIPVADLIKIKHLTRKGKSQLVNMQLDALIKPTLIHSEHADSEDLPLAARAEAAGAGRNAQDAQREPPVPGMYGLMGHPASSSPRSTASGTTAGSRQFSPLGMGNVGALPTASLPPSLGHQSTANTTASMPFSESASSLPHMPMGQPLQPQFATKDSVESLTNISGSMLQIANGLPAINTNIVIDNNMAETLVNYFYMVASNNQLQSPALGPSQMPQLAAQGGSAVSLAPSMGSAVSLASPQLMGGSAVSLESPQLMGGSSAGMGHALPSAIAVNAPVSQGQQQLFGSTYDLSRLQGLAEDNSRSFL